MGWLNDLCVTYEQCESIVGKKDHGLTLLPIGHSTQNAQIEVTISKDGIFLNAEPIESKKQIKKVGKSAAGETEETLVNGNPAETIIPVTEDSVSRSSGIAPHPLCDKLIYLAGDYEQYVSAGDGKKAQECHEAYMEQLRSWNDSVYTNEKVNAICQYLSKGTLIRDLLDKEVIKLENGILDSRYKIQNVDPKDSFVRFRVLGDGIESAVWEDSNMYHCFQEYYTHVVAKADHTKQTLCYVTGKECYCTDKHPSKLLTSGDKGKLISANDTSGFTYRGRFDKKEEASAISYELSQKAHNALKWLIQKQGVRINEVVMLVWGSVCVEVPNPGSSLWDLLDEETKDAEDAADILETNSQHTLYAYAGDTKELYAEQIRRAIYGSHREISDGENVTIMTLEAATIGRVSITYYKQLTGSRYKANLLSWYETCCYFDDRKGINTPSLYDIIDAAYGIEQNGIFQTKDKVKQAAFARLLPCIIDRKNVPFDIVELLYLKASNPITYDKKRRKVRQTAGAVIRKYYNRKYENKNKEEYSMALQEERTDRDYLFGRLLAVAQAAESRALWNASEKRDTNAERLMNAFRSRPYVTWGLIDKKLQPYWKRLKSNGAGEKDAGLFYKNEIRAIMDQFRITQQGKSEYECNDPLNPTFLLGYNAELDRIYSGKKEQNEIKEKENADE